MNEKGLRRPMVILFLALISVIITLPIFLSDNLFIAQDILFHFTWAGQFHHALMDGALYPRWVDTPFGYGSPVFIFYAPLGFYLISIIKFITGSLILSIKLVICLSFFLSGITMFFFVRNLNGDRAGFVSAILYQLIPYHTFNLFTRGVFPELLAFIWFPLILLFIRKMFLDKKPITIAFTGLAYAGLIMTHLVSAFMFTFVMIGYGLYLTFIEKKSGLLSMLITMLLGLGLSSVYLLPVVFERAFIHIEFIKFFNYTDCFLFLSKNLSDRHFYPIPHWIFIIEAGFVIFSILLIKRKFIDRRNVLFVLLLSVSLLLTLPLSSLIWKYVPEFSNLQFPWRWLMVSGFSLSALAGTVIVNLKGSTRTITILFILPMLILSFLNIRQVSFFTNEDTDRWIKSPVLYAPIEYRPIWLQQHRKNLPPTEKVLIARGVGSVDIVEWTAHRRILLAEGKTDLTLKVSTFYFPGWTAEIDGKSYNILIDKENGSMILEIPKGRHEIQLTFRDTQVRILGTIISISSLFLMLALTAYAYINLSKKKMRIKHSG